VELNGRARRNGNAIEPFSTSVMNRCGSILIRVSFYGRNVAFYLLYLFTP
jgi:hypothetical protein